MKNSKNALRQMGVIFSAVGLVMAAVAAVFLCLNGEIRIGAIPFGINAIVFLVIGIVFLVLIKRKQAKNDELLSRGEAMTARVIALEQNTSISYNSRHPVRLVCSYEENGTTYICRSDDISGTPQLSSDTVTVYRDPYNIKRYYVDLQSILKETVEL